MFKPTGATATRSEPKSGEVSAIDFRGVQPNFGEVYANATTLEGRFIGEGDDLHKEKVVMLGQNVAPVLFPEGHPIGKDVLIDGEDFQVIGVVEKPKGGFGMGDEDRRVLIPFSTFRKIYPDADEVQMRAQAYPKMLDQAVDQMTRSARTPQECALWRKRQFFDRHRRAGSFELSQHHDDGLSGHDCSERHRTADWRRRA